MNRFYKVDCFQPSPYTWAQSRGSGFGFLNASNATPLVFPKKTLHGVNWI
jgi:hypothetical protein